MNRQQWHAATKLPQDLAVILAGPVMASALDVLEGEALTPRPLPPGAQPTDYIAHGQRREGFLECLAGLRALARPLKAAPAPIESTFEPPPEPTKTNATGKPATTAG